MILYYLLSALYVLVCILLLLVILMQQGKGDMAAAFGGGSSQSAFGARAGATVLSKATTVLAVLFMLGALARIGLVIWGWQNQEYLVTTRRIIKAEGVLNKAMTDSSLEKINDAHLTQSWLGRIFRYGHLDIMTAADEPGAVEDFPMMADAIQFKIAMMNQKELLERPDLARPAAQRPSAMPPMQRAEALPPRAGSDQVQAVRVPPLDVGASLEPEASGAPEGDTSPAATSAGFGGSAELAATLERLAGLRDRGLITPEEYEAKKRDILERM